MHIEYYASDNYAINNNTEEPELDTAGIYMREDVIDARRIEDKNPYMRKDLVDVKIGRRIISLVRVGLIEHCQIEIVRAFGHAQEQNVKLERKSEVRPNNFLRLCGTFINHPSVLVEHAPCGDLLTFLSRRPQRLAVKVDIMLQIVGVLSVMEKHNLFHGNIRCRRFVVFENESTSSYHIKPGDAGVSSFLDGLPVDSEHNLERLPWLAPERRIKENGKFPEPTFETECYAVGTAFYEILCGDDNFETQIENLENNQLKLVSEFLQAKNILPKPVLLQLPADSEEAPSPEVRHAMEEIYKLVKLCWSEDPNDRPSTSDLRSQLDELSEDVDNIQNETQSQVLRRIMYDAGNDEPQVTRVTEDRICEFVNSHRTMMLHMKHVHVGDKIGHGFYGEVFDGEIDVPRMFLSAEQEKKRVAIKKLKAGPRDGSFIKEIMTATGLDDPNIVKVLYCSYNPRGHLSDINMLIMEYMNKGSLSSYLETERPRPKTSDLMKIIEDIVKGMVYLAGKNIVHRDLAARNILLSWDESLKILTAKVSDFGLSRRMEKDTQHYRLKKGEKLPVFWMPPEQHQFTTKGDVWSFGVVMWETMTYGCHPRDCDIKNPRMQQDVFAAKVDKGWRLPQKFKLDGQYKSIEEDIYGVMGKCWSKLPEDRPFFVDIKNEIETIHQHYVLKASHSMN
jgi:serine/threonine protein kinase